MMKFTIPWWAYITLGWGLGVTTMIPVLIFSVCWVSRETKEEKKARERLENGID